ncbi:polycomb group protein ASXL1 isoform X2 [Eublepharis macularius]|uniref:Polycomb group protein ASXL1 isoform X2 n=1 Tax=Eublepharis macularius TaxID=481883 RepID=A0AA97L133_EUBMA|nr:polycomb group protein ASXL1 isoform X2 [Eublepharis macularius]
MKEMKQRRKKERTWAEAARLVLENYSDGPMTPKQILQVIESEGLKEMSGTSPLACLNAMLHSNSRSCDGLFYKLPGRISLFSLKKDAVQWSRSLSAPEGEELDDAVDAESSGSNEASTVSGDNDVSLDETSSNASCSTEPQSKSTPALRESHRAVSQTSKQKKKTGMMLPRVVLTPLKVNGAHMETSSGLTGRQAGGESSSSSSLSAPCSAAVRSRTEIARDPPQLLRGFRKPAGGQMKRNRGDDVDFETPGSILVNTNLRALINSRTFNALPLPFQQQLLLLLPEVDRQAGTDGLMRLSGSALNNEFFTHAAQSWRERLADGEFTHEMQVRLRQEMEKEKKMEQWKEKFFEDYYGQKLGLTREEPLEQNSAQLEDTKNGSTSSAPGGPVRTQRGPVTRQRDGHFKKRSLRSRTRRSLYKPREQEQAESAKEASSVEPEPPSPREVEPEVALREGGQASPKPESPPEAARLPSEGDDVATATAASRIPSLPQESQDLESKEQKRKCFEQAASASFPEKKPRLEDRQSFRNTIESVHPEKPQPTKEEPKVPPIRIQLSRIKPPWVVKGQPAYQICPRIIPNPEPSSQDGAGATASADCKACALQGRIQREAAAPASAIGGGGGPGGGGGSSPDKGGGGGSSGGGGGGSTGGRGRQSSNRPKHWRVKRARGKCLSNLQRTQLLPPSHLELPVSELVSTNSPTYGKEASPPRAEGATPLRQTADLPSLAAEGAVCLAEASGSSCSDGTLAKLPLDCIAMVALDSHFRHLPSDTSGGQCPGAASQGAPHQQEGTELRPGIHRSGPWLEDLPVNAFGDNLRAEGCGNAHPVVLTCKENSSGGFSPVAASAPESQEPGAADVEERPATGLPAGQHRPDPGHSGAIGMEDAAPQFHVAPLQVTRQWHGEERPSGGDEDEASQTKPVPPPGGLTASSGAGPPRSSPPQWGTLAAGREMGVRELEVMQNTSPASDEETRSMLSETTETASDLEAELTDENAELDQAKGDGAAPSKSGLEDYARIKADGSARSDFCTPMGDLPSAAGPVDPCRPEKWGPQRSLPQQSAGSSSCVDVESQEPQPPLRTSRPLSVEANSPLVVQLLKASLPLQAVLPGALNNSKVGPAEHCSPQSGSRRASSCAQGPPQAEPLGTTEATRNGHPAPLRDSPKRHCAPGLAALPRESQEKQPDSLETCPDFSPSSGAAGRMARVTQKPEKLGLRGGLFSPCICEGQKEPAAAPDLLQKTSAASTLGGNPQEKLKPTRFFPPSSAALGPDQFSGDSVPKNHGVHGKKVFGSSFPCSITSRAQPPKGLEPCPVTGTRPSKPLPLPKSVAPGVDVQAVREDWPPKQRTHVGSGGVENKHILACSGPAKRNVEKRKEAPPSPADLMEHLQSSPSVKDLPFFKLPKELGKGVPQPLEPSSIPSQLNIKQAFYGKLSKLQLNSPGFNCASNTPVFPRSLAESMMQLSHKANFVASHGVSLSAQMFADSSGMEEISLKCSCRLKAMIMCCGRVASKCCQFLVAIRSPSG